MSNLGTTATSPVRVASRNQFDVNRVRSDFPILNRLIYGKPLVYLDNAATSQKPRSVIDAEARFYEEENANIHRGVHWLSEKATQSYEQSREKIGKFLGASDPREIVFVRGTTEAINLVAQTFGRKNVSAGDEVLITGMEHHSNIVPWQMLCTEKGAQLRVAPINDRGELLLDQLERLLTPKTKLLAITHVSNALGTINPLREIIRRAHRRDIPVVVDGAQAVQHLRVDVQELDCDFYAFSGHKMYGPTGIGALYGKRQLLEDMPPYQGGGDMILSVTFEKTVYNKVPHKFEAGTPNMAGAVGLGAAIDYLGSLERDEVHEHEHDLLSYGTKQLERIPGLKIIGSASKKTGVIAFVMEGIHAHDIGTILDREGIAIRTGHHCAQPLMHRFGVAATARASFGLYNTRAEVDALAQGLEGARKVFA